MKAKVTDELKQHFRPEFLNRVDEIIVFPHLTREEITRIVDLEIAKLDKRLKDKDMGIDLTPAAKDLLAKRGYDPVLGARPLRRTIQREIEDALSEKILYAEFTSGQYIRIDTEGEGKEETFTFSSMAHPGHRPADDLPELPEGAALDEALGVDLVGVPDPTRDVTGSAGPSAGSGTETA
jgi:ATP-dependent Clp protease ATP-binding subunit ClpC